MRKLCPLLIGKSGILPVRLGIFQIDLPMRHVQVAAEDHRLLPLQFFQIREEILLPLHPVWQSRQLILGIGRVHRHHIVFRKLRRNDTALLVVLLHANAVGHRQRLLLREHGRARIALLHRIIPVLVISRQIQVDLPLLQLALLNAENIRIHLLKIFQKALLHTGTQAIHIPGNQLHKISSVR